MNSFLSIVSQDLLNKFGANMSDVVIVFPNKRAGLFMNQHLATLSDTPIWAPKYQTISELFQAESDFTLCDSIQSVCELYRIYEHHVVNPDSLDHFYGWGEVIMSDFDDIDKHMVDASKLFQNISAYKSMEQTEFLTPEQEHALGRFFSGFSTEKNTQLKEKFLEVWNIMPSLYQELNKVLQSKQLMYEGALYRNVIQGLLEGRPMSNPNKTYVFVGFNVLNDVEENLFKILQGRGQALFYWDYDVFYTQSANTFEAGYFIRENLKKFPNQLPECYFNNFNKAKKIEYISSGTENAQARFIPKWLQENLTQPENESAIVLCNEMLLQPVLHSLPEKDDSSIQLKSTNITMGFPLTDTPIYSLVVALIKLQAEGYNHDNHKFLDCYIRNVANHPYGNLLSEDCWKKHAASNSQLLEYLNNIIESLAKHYSEIEKPDIHQQLYNESIFQTHCVLSRFMKLTEDNLLDVSINTIKRLLQNVLMGISIPFHGEPAIGLQVMGVLETRNLDFKHILMLSVNEGLLPKSVSDNSFIPYQLKEAFGLTTIRHKIAVYAFYFYRLIQRAERITLLYNNSTEGCATGEMSRFLRQLLAETEHNITCHSLQSGQCTPTYSEISVSKTDEIMRFLQKRYDIRVKGSSALSPSALNCFLDCSLKFYYKYVADIKVQRDVTDGIDAAMFGTLFHKAAELIYTDLANHQNVIVKGYIEELLEHYEITLGKYVDSAFRSEYYNVSDDEKLTYTGSTLVVRKVLITYLKQLLEHDKQYVLIHEPMLETKHYTQLEVPTPKGSLYVKVGGVIDRMDTILLKNPQTGKTIPTLRVVDYKTGGKPKEPNNMDILCMPSKDRPDNIFQIFLYAMIMCKEQKQPVMPALFYLQKSNNPKYSPLITYNKSEIYNFGELACEYEKLLIGVLKDLFDPGKPFTQSGTAEKCQYCDYRCLCNK